MSKTEQPSAIRKFKKRYIVYALMLSYCIMCQACMMMRYSAEETRRFFANQMVSYEDHVYQYDGRQLHYISTGSNNRPLMVFLHGSPGSWNAFKEYMADPVLLQNYRLISIDRPGFGQSDFGRVMDLEAQAVLIDQFISSLGISEPATLVGHSLGGPLILKLASIRPKQYRNLVIISGSVDPDAESSERWRPIIAAFPLRYLIPGALRPSNDELWLLKDDLYELRPHLRMITSTVTVIHGTEDRLVPFSNAAFIEAELSGSRNIHLIPIKGADHFIPWTHYEIMRDVLSALDNN